MNIIKTNIDAANKKEVYRMTKSEAMRVQDVEKGVTLTVDKWMLYTETKTAKDGNQSEQRVLSIVSGDTKISTISNTFIESFMEIVDLMDGEDFAIIITGGTSKGGRTFVNCELDCN